MRDRIRQIQNESEGEEGFTLIELLIVIVVLGILAGIVVFGVSTFRSDSQTAACQASLKTVSVAADAYDAKVGTYPNSITLLAGTATTTGYLKDTPTTAVVGNITFNTTAHRVTSDKQGCTIT